MGITRQFRTIPVLKVSQAASHLGVNSQTLYFYERVGLIPPPERTEAGYRLYSEKDLDRLTFIIRAKALGLSLEEIGDILALKDGSRLTCRALHDLLAKKVERIERQIRQLQLLRDELLPLLERCGEVGQGAERECTVLDGEKVYPTKEAEIR